MIELEHSVSQAGVGVVPSPEVHINISDTPAFCTACTDSISPSSIHFACTKCRQAHLCQSCFANYITHCCECWATSTAAIPARCLLPQCGNLIDPHYIRSLLIQDQPQLWEKYLQVQLKKAMDGKDLLNQDLNEVLIACAACGSYAEVFVDSLHADALDKTVKEGQEVSRVAIFQEATRLKEKLAQRLDEEKKLAFKMEDYKAHVEVLETKERIATLKDVIERGQLKVQEMELACPTLKYASEQKASSNALSVNELLEFNGIGEFFQWKSVYDALNLHISKSKLELHDAEQTLNLLAAEDDYDAKVKVFMDHGMRVGLESIRAELELKFPEEFKYNQVDAGACTSSQFFVCKDLFCHGAFCMRCRQYIHKDQILGHHCNLDPVNQLYFQILDVLAETSSRKCPSCGRAGRKDLECTHITCEHCNEKFCYVCGVPEKDIPGGFSEHNQWTLKSKPEDKKCPLYLQYKYGGISNGDHRTGDPGLSLEKFHREMQTDALKKLQEQIQDPELWKQVEQKFPQGDIIPPLKKHDKDTWFGCIRSFVLTVSAVGNFLTLLYFCALYTWIIVKVFPYFSYQDCYSLAPALVVQAIAGLIHGAWVSLERIFCGERYIARRYFPLNLLFLRDSSTQNAGALVLFIILITFMGLVWICVLVGYSFLSAYPDYYSMDYCSPIVVTMSSLFINSVWIAAGVLTVTFFLLQYLIWKFGISVDIIE